jgi:hypothetical protein
MSSKMMNKKFGLSAPLAARDSEIRLNTANRDFMVPSSTSFHPVFVTELPCSHLYGFGFGSLLDHFLLK